MLRAGRVSVDVCMEFDNNDTLKRAVEVGAGLSIVPKGIGQREESMGQLCFIPFRQPAKWIRKISIIRRRGRQHSKAEMLFLRTLRAPI
jgi:DNA-binding transcriptional LysR family regulator